MWIKVRVCRRAFAPPCCATLSYPPSLPHRLKHLAPPTTPLKRVVVAHLVQCFRAGWRGTLLRHLIEVAQTELNQSGSPLAHSTKSLVFRCSSARSTTLMSAPLAIQTLSRVIIRALSNLSLASSPTTSATALPTQSLACEFSLHVPPSIRKQAVRRVLHYHAVRALFTQRY